MIPSGMAIEDRRERERAGRRRLIITTARTLAEAEGWDAVTTRRLSTEIEYSQPVLYKHFSGMDRIVEAIALDGFAELTEVMQTARADVDTAGSTLHRIARAYLDFARRHPAVYDAMFTRATTLRFAAHDTPAPLLASFAELRSVVALVTDQPDVDTVTEVVLAALHGLVTLDRAGRLRPGYESERLQALLGQFTGP